jgi:hypothetical protein
MIGIGRVVDRVSSIHGGEFQEKILLPLIGYQA